MIGVRWRARFALSVFILLLTAVSCEYRDRLPPEQKLLLDLHDALRDNRSETFEALLDGTALIAYSQEAARNELRKTLTRYDVLVVDGTDREDHESDIQFRLNVSGVAGDLRPEPIFSVLVVCEKQSYAKGFLKNSGKCKLNSLLF